MADPGPGSGRKARRFLGGAAEGEVAGGFGLDEEEEREEEKHIGMPGRRGFA